MKKKESPVNPQFTFWVNNREGEDRKFYLSDIRQLFQKWLVTQPLNWVTSVDDYLIVALFISDKQGMNAVCTERDQPALVRFLKPDINERVNPK